MVGVAIHVLVFAVVNAFLVGIWLVTGGTETELRAASEDPIQAVRDGFWPLFVIASWGLGLVIHVGIWSMLAASRGSRHHHRHHRAPSAPPSPPVPPATSASHTARDLGREASKLAGSLIETLSGRLNSAPTRPGGGEPAGRRWLAAMFTDIAGSTELNEVLGDDAYLGILTEHRRMVRAHLDQHGGTEVSTQGDGFLVRFDDPDAAVACGVAIQRELRTQRDGGTFAPELRIGIHAGEAVTGDNDLIGNVINLASRVAGAAGPGEILVTEPVADHTNPNVRLLDRGLQPLRGISQPRHLLAVMWDPNDPAAAETTPLDDSQSL